MRRLPPGAARALTLAALAAALAPASAAARDPARWHLMARTSIPLVYYQGVTADPARRLFFDGVFVGLYRTDARLRQTAAIADAIPPDVAAREGYNHIGDISWDRAEGGRVLLPLECFDPRRGNFCGTGSIGVADPDSLRWRYYVRLDPRDIAKAMWCEVAPDGRLIWTSSGDDLLAYRAADVRPANAAPAGPALRPVRRLRGAVPPGGVTGAAFYRGRLLLAGQQGRRFTVWSVSPATGARRLEVERDISGESEGLAVVDALGGILQWQVQPLTATPPPTYPQSTLLSFLPRLRPRVAVDPAFAPARRRTRFAVRVTAAVLGRVRPLAGATVTLAGVRRRTDARGRARLTVRLPHPGVWRVTARWRGDRGVARVRAGPPARAGGGRG